MNRILSLVRYWIGTDGSPVNGVEEWQKLHILPEDLSEYICHELLTTRAAPNSSCRCTADSELQGLAL